MQRPSSGYRGGTRASHQYRQDHHDENDLDDNSSLSNSDDQQERKGYLVMEMNNDFESAIRNLRPSAVQQKKMKTNLNISKQKADLPQLNPTHDENHDEQNHFNGENHLQEKSSSSTNRWFPKADVGHVDSDDFIRHNHVG